MLVLATVVGWLLRDLKAIFIYIQEFWSIAYPSVCALFLAGFFYKRATARGAIDCLFAFAILWIFRNRSDDIPPKPSWIARSRRTWPPP